MLSSRMVGMAAIGRDGVEPEPVPSMTFEAKPRRFGRGALAIRCSRRSRSAPGGASQ